MTASAPALASGITVERLSGAAAEPFLPDLARLRMEVFREFPYLYEGSLENEQRHLRAFMRSPNGVLVVARDGARVVGASTGLPLADEAEHTTAPFRQHGYDLASVFYFGESVLARSHRGQGIGVHFFAQREAHARTQPGLRHTAFCAVERPADHPRRPPDYQPLDAFWRRRGYAKHPTLRTHFTWQDLDESAPSPKPMTFWLKAWPGADTPA